ncbi:unnamed protein product [Caenorhabditis sp. 36 PRJEB53466]|nr:unnamed protein product [Caenorhabditis sp. 36 PRJEB53466]
MRGIIILPLIFFNSFLNASFLHTEIEDDVETEISDWSEAKTDGKLRLITFLVGIDSSLTRYYNYDENRIRSALIVLMHTVNQYFYPLNIRLSIIDILPVKGTSMGLDDFTAWKKEQRNLMEHDVTVLLRHNYEGGIAYSNGICSKNSLMISGFFPESTMNNAWVFMHQLAHVVGLSHQIRTKCNCKNENENAKNGKCLKLRGFGECSVQEMVDKLTNHTCLSQQSQSLTSGLTMRKGSLPICGNGMLEEEEECDCGPERFCDNILCDAVKCRFIVKKAYLTNIIPMTLAIFAFGFVLLLWKILIFPSIASLLQKLASLRKAEVEEQPENGNDVDVEQAPVASSQIGIYLYDNLNEPNAVIGLGTYGRNSDLSTAVQKLKLLPCGTWCGEQTQKTDVEQIASILSKQAFTRTAKVFIITTQFIDSYGLQSLVTTSQNVMIQQVMIPQSPGVVTYDAPYYNYYRAYYDNYRRYSSRMEQIYPYVHVEVPTDQYPFIEQADRYENYDFESWASGTCYSLIACQECMTIAKIETNVDSVAEIETVHSGDSNNLGKVIEPNKLTSELVTQKSKMTLTTSGSEDYEYEITADPPGMKINKTPLQDEVNEKSVSDEDLI